MRPKRLISLLVAVCMMITMLPLSAVTAFAADTSTVHEANDGDGIYKTGFFSAPAGKLHTAGNNIFKYSQDGRESCK